MYSGQELCPILQRSNTDYCDICSYHSGSDNANVQIFAQNVH